MHSLDRQAGARIPVWGSVFPLAKYIQYAVNTYRISLLLKGRTDMFPDGVAIQLISYKYLGCLSILMIISSSSFVPFFPAHQGGLLLVLANRHLISTTLLYLLLVG